MGSSDPIIPPEVQLAKEIHVLTAQRADVATEDSTFNLTTSNFSSYRATTYNQQHSVIHQPSATDQPSVQSPTTVTARTTTASIPPVTPTTTNNDNFSSQGVAAASLCTLCNPRGSNKNNRPPSGTTPPIPASV